MSKNSIIQTDEQILAAFELVLPYINRLVREDMAVGLTDLKQYISYYRAREFELDLPAGKPINGIDTIEECIRTGKDTYADIPPNVYGRTIKTIFTPIYGDNNKIIGTLSSGIDLEHSLSLVDNVERLASATEQVSHSVDEIAKSASELAGAGIMAVQMSHNLLDKNKSTFEILEFIKNIAAQTNLLGLNAAIEAARAGEQGRGFAVVAGEVRSLAQRSAEAAREIKKLISSSIEKVENGSRLVENAGASMDGIVSQVRKVSDFITEISSTAKEQVSAISQITDAVGQLDLVTQQNAALVENGAATAKNLTHQSQLLAGLVGRFQVEKNAMPANMPHEPQAAID